ncbi:MAG TPA: phosphoenolpyruvate--protein phosphotransferase [Usitatibacter sp.]|nr:phosphoenolpyruvate--protein phosphotransferase [Usitatibacter sp.]
MSKPVITLVSPLAGWCMPLGEVPDPVFAQAMAGDGVAIDPTSNVVHAPCSGEVVLVPGARHAVTLRQGGMEITVHVGVDTVKLGGRGFEVLAPHGTQVTAGTPLLRFDLQHVARTAPSLVTPVIVASGGVVLGRAPAGPVEVGAFLMEVALTDHAPEAGGTVERTLSRDFVAAFEHGLHLRPAALIAAALKPFGAEVCVRAHGREADARSPVAMMALGVRSGERVEVCARGADAEAALLALERVLVVPAPAGASAPSPTAPRARIEAAVASRGLAAGPACQWVGAEIAVAERGSDTAGETQALAKAVDAVRAQVEASAAGAPVEQREILDGHAQLVQDPGLMRQASEWLERGKSAAYAWRQATRATARMLSELDDPRMRERAADLRDLERQVLQVLSGRPAAATREFPQGAIVLADEVLPSQLPLLVAARIGGMCCARGGATSHVALLAAANGMPMLVGAGAEILAIADGTPLVLDAEGGVLEVDPPAAQRQARERKAAHRAAEEEADLEAARHPATTRDGVRIVVNANLGSAAEAAGALRRGAEGCGLLRTEFLFLERAEAPSREEQAAEYQRVAAALAGLPLAIRTMDVGGDKPLAYMPAPHEDNPALGLRGIRASLAHPALLRAQLLAILDVRPAGQCRILLPMVTEPDELTRVRRLVVECAAEAGAAVPELGVMIETPASALLAPELAAAADFFSIGTNDLAQYTLAIDRGHPQLAGHLDALHPAVLRLVALVADAGREWGRSVSVCGALASDVDALPVLLGLGVREISATAAAIPRLKRVVRELSHGECEELARIALQQSGAAAVRERAARAVERATARVATQISGGSP